MSDIRRGDTICGEPSADDLTHYREAVARLRKENSTLRAVLDGIARARPARGGLRRLVEQIQQVARDPFDQPTPASGEPSGADDTFDDAAFRASQPSIQVPAFDTEGEPIQHTGPRIPGSCDGQRHAYVEWGDSVGCIRCGKLWVGPPETSRSFDEARRREGAASEEGAGDAE